MKNPHHARYLIISPVRNEAQYIEQTIAAIINQTVKPVEWIIVNDASTDQTAEIVLRYAGKHTWIRLIDKVEKDRRQDRQRGKGVIDTFYYGYDKILSDDYDFIIKMDGDVSFEPDYFESVLNKFAQYPKLGIAGGGLYEPEGHNWVLRSSQDHVGGPTKMYRRSCFDEMGGLVPALGWDGIDEWKALALGWEVKSFIDIKIFHHRVMGNATGPFKSKIEQGYGAHYMGYHPLYVLARGFRHVITWPYLFGGMALVAAYFVAKLQGRERLSDAGLIRYIRSTQLRQLSGLMSGRQVLKGQKNG